MRDAVREVIADSSRHDWSIDDLTAELEARGVAADFSSVFRALAFLEGEGAVSRVELVQVNELPDTSRGAGGFGHTGR